MDRTLEGLAPLGPLQAEMERYAQEQESLVERAVAVQQIPAPTGQEGARAAWVEAAFRELGLERVERDALLNVYARVPGRRPGPGLLVSAHMDTVFPPGTDLALRREPERDRLSGPGIGDNSVGVAGLVTLAESLVRLPTPPVDVWLVANSNEEGLGDLKGMRAAVDRLHGRAPGLGAAIVLEGMGLGRVVHRGLGVRRYRIAVQAPGGHSWGDFGVASAVHALVALAAEIAHLQVPRKPRTSFNIGRIQGGRSVNTIADHAELELDLRSEAPETLAWLDEQVRRMVERHRSEHRRLHTQVTVHMVQIGHRPAGGIPEDHPLVQAASAVLARLRVRERRDFRISSTDANVPLSRGIPAVCIGLTEGGDAHRLSEWIALGPLVQGMRQLLCLTWWAAHWLGGPGNGG